VSKKWFRGRPDAARTEWAWRGFLLVVVGAGLAYGLGVTVG